MLQSTKSHIKQTQVAESVREGFQNVYLKTLLWCESVSDILEEEHFISNYAVCRTALATPALLITRASEPSQSAS